MIIIIKGNNKSKIIINLLFLNIFEKKIFKIYNLELMGIGDW